MTRHWCIWNMIVIVLIYLLINYSLLNERQPFGYTFIFILIMFLHNSMVFTLKKQTIIKVKSNAEDAIKCTSTKTNIEENNFTLFKYLSYLLSFDYHASAHLKEVGKTSGNSPTTKCIKSNIIISFNRNNLILSAIFSVIVIFSHLFQGLIHSELIKIVIVYVLFLRLLSRSFEVFFAFAQDAVEEMKTSSISSIDRIKLSINSYIELIMLNTAVYFTIGVEQWMPKEPIIEAILSSFATSVGIATFSDVNMSYTFNTVGNLIAIGNTKYVMLLQLIVSFSLIILNIAAYFSEKSK